MNIKLDSFMYVYMYHLEKFLLTKTEDIKNISFQSDEANTDRPLKEYMKNLIENEFYEIPKNTDIKSLDIESKHFVTIEDLYPVRISKVLLPEEITPDIKENIINSKKSESVYTNPDLCLEISMDNQIFWETIELKSTKSNSIPGSSIQQILPNEWVIFIKHQSQSIDVVTGKYIYAINSKMQFPDRSPRPQVSFNELKKWNKTQRLKTNTQLKYLIDENINEKYELISDWQKVLSNRWIEMLFETDTVRRNEPWFNNNMRKFILDFLAKYESLSSDEQIQFKTKIKKLIID